MRRCTAAALKAMIRAGRMTQPNNAVEDVCRAWG